MKKLTSALISIFFIIVFWDIFVLSAFASTIHTGFETDILTSSEEKEILSNFEINKITEEGDKKAIECFDVNEKGNIAVGSSDFLKRIIKIYSEDGAFQYGFEFETAGKFGLEWDNDNILIYNVRGNIVISVDSKGDVVAVDKIADTINNQLYWKNTIYATKRTNNNKTYEIRNDMGPLNIFSFNYSQLLITDQNGDVKIIYDVNSYQITKYIIIIIIIISIIVFLIIPTIYKLYKDGKKKHNIYF